MGNYDGPVRGIKDAVGFIRDLDNRVTDIEVNGGSGGGGGSSFVQGVSVKDFGALGDDVTDDTEAFQDAIDYCYENKRTLLVPDGRYVIRGTLVLPEEIDIIGNCVHLRAWDWQNAKCILRMYNMVGFKGAVVDGITEVCMTMKNLFIRSEQYSTTNILFKDIDFYGSNISDNNFLGFGVIFQGRLTALTRVCDNNFFSTLGSLVKRSDVAPNLPEIEDTYICRNYISGSVEFNPVFFDVYAMAHSYIQDNFIDFAKIIFKVGYGCGGTTFSGNIFDMSYRVFTGNFSRSRIVNNQFTHINKDHSWFNNPDTEMETLPWACMIMESLAFNDLEQVTVVGNYAYMTTNFILFAEPAIFTPRMRMIKIADNIYDEQYIETRVDFKMGGQGEGTSDIYIDDLMYLNVTTLPNPAIHDVDVSVSFHGQILNYNGKLVRNDDGVWKDFMGNIVT